MRILKRPTRKEGTGGQSSLLRKVDDVGKAPGLS